MCACTAIRHLLRYSWSCHPQYAGVRRRYRAKWQLVHNLYQIGYNAKQVCEMFGLIDGMMHLRVDLEEPFEQELDDLEESLQMPFPIQNRST
jgi:hypothetical protein